MDPSIIEPTTVSKRNHTKETNWLNQTPLYYISKGRRKKVYDTQCAESKKYRKKS